MHWTEPATAADAHFELEKQLWGAANMLWVGADLNPSEWSEATETPRKGCPRRERGGANQFYTPTSILRLIVEILEPHHGRIYDPACGSGGMFASFRRPCGMHFARRKCASASGIVQSARFVEEHHKIPTAEISVHGLSGDIRQGNTYNEDLHDSVGRFDVVLANPPFNVSKIDKEPLADDPRYAFGLLRFIKLP